MYGCTIRSIKFIPTEGVVEDKLNNLRIWSLLWVLTEK